MISDDAFDQLAHLVGFIATATVVGVLLFRYRNNPTPARNPTFPEPTTYPALSPGPLLVQTERFLDTDQQTPGGPYDFYYSGVYFGFTHGDRVAKGRFYDDEPADTFSLILWPPTEQPRGASYAAPPYNDPFLAEIVHHLRDREPARTKITFLCNDGYLPLDLTRF